MRSENLAFSLRFTQKGHVLRGEHPPAMPADSDRAKRSGKFEALTSLVVTLAPAVLALVRSSEESSFRQDPALLRDVSLWGLGVGGFFSRGMTTIATLFPIGSLAFRATVVSVIACALSAASLYRLALYLLREVETSARLKPSYWAAPALAGVGTSLGTLSTTFQSEATAGGSSLIAVALSLFALEASYRPGRRLLTAMTLVAATALECPLLGFGALSACVALFWLNKEPVPQRLAKNAVTAGLVLVTVVLAGTFATSVVPKLRLELGPVMAHRGIPTGLGGPNLTLFEAWSKDVGLFSLISALGGAVFFGAARDRRPMFLSLGAILVIELGVSLAMGRSDSRVAYRVLSFGILGGLSSVGVFWVLTELARRKFPLARPSAALFAALYLTMVVLTSEDAHYQTNRNVQVGPRVITRLSLEALPARAVVVVHDPTLAKRLWAAQLSEGRRLDVLVVAPEFFAHGSVATHVLAREPALREAVRAHSLTGTMTELGLSTIAQKRPLFLDYDPLWDKAVLAHVRPDGAWFRFHVEPQPARLSEAERERIGQELRPLAEAASDPRSDAMTLSLASAQVENQVLLLLHRGETQDALALLRRAPLRRTDARSMELRFAEAFSRLPTPPVKKKPAKEVAAKGVPARGPSRR